MTQQKDTLTIDQKIAIAKMAVDLYSIEFSEGHKYPTRGSLMPDAPKERDARDRLHFDWKIQDVSTDFRRIYDFIEDAILKEPVQG